MRLLIESRNRWTIELTSTKHLMVGCTAKSSDSKLVPHKTTIESIVQGSDIRAPGSLSDTDPLVKEHRSTINEPTAPRRHKSLRKRIGRFLLHFSRTIPSAAYNEHAYRYKGDASELPAGEIPIEGSAPVHEMPDSFANLEAFELEQPRSYHLNNSHFLDSLYDENPGGYCQEFCKPSYNGEIAIYRDSSQIANPKQLPRLEVPRTVHDVPPMITDQSPISPATISPNTPVEYRNNRIQPCSNSQPALHLVSPCDRPNASPSYSGLRPQYNYTQCHLRSPMTRSSAGSSSTTTPSSAHPLSAHASFDAWPQPKPEYLRSAFPQRYPPMNQESNTHFTPSPNPNTWVTEFGLHPCRHYKPSLEIRYQAVACDTIMSLESPIHSLDYDVQRTNEKPLYEKLQCPSVAYTCDAALYNCHPEDEALPAYSSVVANPPQYLPAMCQHCGKSFTGKYGNGNLKRHIRQIHESVMGGAIHMCRLCMKTYNRADALRKHSWKKHRQEDARPNKRKR